MLFKTPLAVLLLSTACCGQILASGKAPSIQQYEVSFSDHDRVACDGAFAQAFPDGLPMGVGSGLYFEGEQQGKLLFTTITDRGPNAEAPKLNGNESKVFVTPDYAPRLMRITVDGHRAQASDPRPITENGKAVSGLPLYPRIIGATLETPVSDRFQILPTDNHGLDPEGIVGDGQGGYWIADEYGPFLLHLDGKGAIQKKLGPDPLKGELSVAGGLPNILKWRQANRGFEGIARLPDGSIAAVVQSPLNIEGKTLKSASLLRILRYDPQTGATQMFGYPLDKEDYDQLKNAKVGDMVAVDQHHLLLIEQGKDRKGHMQNKIYLADLRGASDLTPYDEEQAPEFNSPKELKKRGIRLIQKEEIVDLRKLGWVHEKAEGLALIDDQRIAVINDNDFGVQTKLRHRKQGTKLKDYRLGPDGRLTLDGEKTDARLELAPLNKAESRSDLWIITLPKPLNKRSQ